MTDRQSDATQPESSPGMPSRPLPVTIVPGMCVVDAADADVGTIVGITQAYCIYRLPDGDLLQVGAWRDLALVNVCPAEPLLDDGVQGKDRRNANATVLRELLALEQIGPLTDQQRKVRGELVAELCGPVLESG